MAIDNQNDGYTPEVIHPGQPVFFQDGSVERFCEPILFYVQVRFFDHVFILQRVLIIMAKIGTES
jgi:hypothetical protein